MTCSLYADVILFRNFTMDLLLLNVLRRVLKLEIRRAGLVSASLFGAVYGLFLMLFPFPALPWLSVCSSPAAAAVTVLLAFPIKRRGEVVRVTAGFYLLSMMTAGAMELLRSELPSIGEGWFVAAAALLSSLTGRLWKSLVEEERLRKQLCRVELYYNGDHGSFTGFLDTGNRLCEPISGKPVSIISAESCGSLFETIHAVSYIPYRTIGREQGVIPAVRAEQMIIWKGERREVIEKPYLALSKQPLSRNNTYQILLNGRFL